MAGRTEPGWQLLRDAIRRAREARAEAEAARGYRMIGSCCSVLVEYGAGKRWLSEGIEYADQTERWNDRHYMAAHLAHVHWATGAAGAASREAAQARADGGAGVTTHVTVLHVLGYLAMSRGDWVDATAHLEEAYRLGTEMHELQRLSPALWGLAETALLQGRADEAVALCEEGYAASAAIEDAVYLFPYVVTGTRAYLRRGEPTNARDWLDRTERLVLLRNIPGTLPALDHAHGLLHLAAGNTGKARETLTLASSGWLARQRMWEGVQSLLDLATCAARSRRPAEAAALRARAHEQASSAGMVALVAGEAAETGAPSPLTAREVEVARLIATGATNREIAAALFIAPKTVSAHVEHILTKLGAGRRAEIAAWSAAHPPTT
jgi:DNA-binding CsgD family transcriptional regulator